MAQGEAALRERLKRTPRDDQTRFALGVAQLVRGVERLGQSLHRYGVRSENTNVPFLRLPVPKNARPEPISYAAFRRLLDDFSRDLAGVEATLADIPLDHTFPMNLPDKYWSRERDMDVNVVFALFRFFGNPTVLPYAVWFN